MPIRNASRRSVVKLLAATPLLTQITARDLYAQAASAVGRDPRQNIYTRLGVKTVINCRGTWTYLSGSLEFPEVRQAQLEAAEHFVNMLELQRAVGKRLSDLTGAESGIVTSGSAGAMAAARATAALGPGPLQPCGGVIPRRSGRARSRPATARRRRSNRYDRWRARSPGRCPARDRHSTHPAQGLSAPCRGRSDRAIALDREFAGGFDAGPRRRRLLPRDRRRADDRARGDTRAALRGPPVR